MRSTWRQTSASSASIESRGPSPSATIRFWSGGGSASLSIFPFVVRGNESTQTSCAGIIAAGSLRASASRIIADVVSAPSRCR
jgi:hypothetical protein